MVGIFLYASEILFFVEDWRTRLTTADGSSLELDPDLLEDAQDEVDLKRTRLVTRIQLSSIFFCQYNWFWFYSVSIFSINIVNFYETIVKMYNFFWCFILLNDISSYVWYVFISQEEWVCIISQEVWVCIISQEGLVCNISQKGWVLIISYNIPGRISIYYIPRRMSMYYILGSSVSDPYHFDLDPDPDPRWWIGIRGNFWFCESDFPY